MQKGNSLLKKEVFLVTWKNQKNHLELFEDIEVFCASYPRFDLNELTEAFSFSKTVFEQEEVRIEKKAIIRQPKPDLPRMFFWEFNYDLIDWTNSRAMVVQRVLERGIPEHWRELGRFYGINNIVYSLREEITYLPDECIDEASSFFNLIKEELLCYKNKRSQPKHWR